MPSSDLAALLREMQPILNPGVYAFSIAPQGMDLAGLELVASMREREGLTIVAEESSVVRVGLPVMFRAAWITLNVDSDLLVVGFTARFAAALAEADIACNVIAGVHHDHLFVPVEVGPRALDVLLALREPT